MIAAPSGYEWLTYREIADRLGIGVDSARHRAKRKGYRQEKGNHPYDPIRYLVPLSDLSPRTAQATTGPTPMIMKGPSPDDRPSEPQGIKPPASSPTIPDHSGMISLDRTLEMLASAEARHAAQAAASERRYEAEVGRLCEQFRAERSFWTERADAAECRAEATERLLFEVLSTLERAIRPPAPLSLRDWLFGRATK